MGRAPGCAMMRAMRTLLSVLLAALLAACGAAGPAPADAGLPDAAEAPADAASPGEDAGRPGADAAAPDAGPRRVTLRIFHTSDEHGWLQPTTESGWTVGGAANVRAWWARDGFDPAKDLALSGGDSWQGAPISGFFQGESAVAAFNLMGYAATAIGNHEFDWGRDAMVKRFAESGYRELAANLRYASTGQPVDFAERWALLDVQGIRVGVIGLTTPDTATATNPKLVADLAFDEPQPTLEAVVPEVRAAGADVVVVLAHEWGSDLVTAVRGLTAKVDLVFSGHDHLGERTTVGSTLVVGSGWGLRGYTVTTLDVDTGAHSVQVTDSRTATVSYRATSPNPVTPDPAVQALLATWQQKLDAALGETIGYTVTGFPLMSWREANWTIDPWLWAFPDADVAVQNFGGLRQAVPAGPITRATVLGVMPFDNRIIQCRITGQQLLDNLQYATANCSLGGCYPSVAGMRFTGSGASLSITLASGAPLDPAATYTVLTSDYLYAGGGGYLFGAQDPNGVDMGVSYRDPIVEWTKAQGTTAQDPLEAHVDGAPRNQ